MADVTPSRNLNLAESDESTVAATEQQQPTTPASVRFGNQIEGPPLEVPPPILPASVATSLQRSSGYTCRGEASGDRVVTWADDSAVSSPSRVQMIRSVKDLLECQAKEQVAMPAWAVKILEQCT